MINNNKFTTYLFWNTYNLWFPSIISYSLQGRENFPALSFPDSYWSLTGNDNLEPKPCKGLLDFFLDEDCSVINSFLSSSESLSNKKLKLIELLNLPGYLYSESKSGLKVN